jgi:16S rRNA processing protein RimM
MKIEDCFKIGSVLKAKGLKGELQLFVDFDSLDRITFNSVFIDMAGKLVPFFVKSFKYQSAKAAYIYFEDVDTVEQTAKLLKRDIYLPNKLKPKKKKEEFTLKDLKGFLAVDEHEGELGEIIEVQELPQQFIALVKYKDCEVLFPLNETIIKGIDIDGRELYVDLPEGLLDIYLD